jgi:hypothetical protein
MTKSTWAKSKEKKKLREDILSGVVTDEMNIRLIYQMHDGIYLKYPYDRFRVNCKNLIDSINKNRTAAAEDAIALGNVLAQWPAPTPQHPTWHNSVAKALLLQDIATGEIVGLESKIVWSLRPEYLEYPLKTFRDHLNKEKKNPTIKAYWEHQRERKRLKKEGQNKSR